MAKALAKVVVLTKDEPGLIEDFVRHHAALFGHRNVIVVDNGSGDEAVWRAYDQMRRLGVTIVRDARPFPQATAWMNDYIASLRGTCEWVLLLETDEFVFLPSAPPEVRGVPREAVHRQLRAVPHDVGLLRYGALLASVVDPDDGAYAAPPSAGCRGYTRPAAQMTKFTHQGWDMAIVRTDAFVRMTMWPHHADVAPGMREMVCPGLGLLHFHNTGRFRLIERARAVATAYRYLEPSPPPARASLAGAYDHLQQVVKTAPSGGHKVKYLASHLRRALVLRTLRAVRSRLPTPAEIREVDSTAFAGENAAEVERWAAARDTVPQEGRPFETWDACLYAEDASCTDDGVVTRMPLSAEYLQVLTVKQVAEALAADTASTAHDGTTYECDDAPLCAPTQLGTLADAVKWSTQLGSPEMPREGEGAPTQECRTPPTREAEAREVQESPANGSRSSEPPQAEAVVCEPHLAAAVLFRGAGADSRDADSRDAAMLLRGVPLERVLLVATSGAGVAVHEDACALADMCPASARVDVAILDTAADAPRCSVKKHPNVRVRMLRGALDGDALRMLGTRYDVVVDATGCYTGRPEGATQDAQRLQLLRALTPWVGALYVVRGCSALDSSDSEMRVAVVSAGCVVLKRS